MKSTDTKIQGGDTEAVIDSQELSSNAKKTRGQKTSHKKVKNHSSNREKSKPQKPQESLEALELKSMLDRDAQRAEFGSAIEKQKNKAKLNRAQGSFAKAGQGGQAFSQDDGDRFAGIERFRADARAPTEEYQYHKDRIVIASLIGFFVVVLLCWGLYLLLSSNAQDPSQYEVVGATSNARINSNTGTNSDTATNSETVSSTALSDRITASVPPSEATQVQPSASSSVDDANSTLGADASESVPNPTPKPLSTPDKPKFETGSTQAASQQESVSQQQAAAQQQVASQNTSALGTDAEFEVQSQVQSAGGETFADPLFVSRMHLAQNIESLEPQGIYQGDRVTLENSDSFRVHFFTHLTGLNDQAVSHRWFYNDALVAQIDMNIGSDSWRASSNKRLNAQTGQWRVEAVSQDGKVLARRNFNVGE